MISEGRCPVPSRRVAGSEGPRRSQFRHGRSTSGNQPARASATTFCAAGVRPLATARSAAHVLLCWVQPEHDY
jgi:hypothetical protein